MKTFIKLLTILILNLGVFYQNALGSDIIKIGLIVPLSGEYSEIGNSIIKSTRIAINKIDDNRIKIIPRDTRSNPIDALRVSKKLHREGVKIIIGPVFNESTKYLDELENVTFISFTNKIIDNPKNVISAGVNAISQINTIKKFNNNNNLSRSIFLIPKTDYKKEIEEAIRKTKIKHKKVFFYDKEPTLLTKQIEKLTNYSERKQQLKNKIKRIENSSIQNKEKKIESLKMKDTLGSINFDSVIIADFDESLKSVANSLLYTDVSARRIKYITLNQWFDKTLLKEKSLQPIYFPSVNKNNYNDFVNNFQNLYNSNPDQLSFLSYDLIGLVYFLLYENNFKVSKKIFYKKNKFKGKIGIFEINKNVITHQLNFYSVENNEFKKIF
tara:strand:- start:1699 stop:2850 length:1152 start_codon:yes stop_codon:yes gene_type:complete